MHSMTVAEVVEVWCACSTTVAEVVEVPWSGTSKWWQ